MARRKSRFVLSPAEQAAELFVRCHCGEDDSRRTRSTYLWFKDGQVAAASGFSCEGHVDKVRPIVNAMTPGQRPHVLVRVIPKPWLIAMADRIGEPIQ